jgi:chaperonin GroEL
MAGDGTPTATVLASTIYAEVLRASQKDATPWTSDKVPKLPLAVSSISSLPTVTANGDVHVGNLIAQAMEKVGKEGVITVKEGRTIEDEIEITEGCGLIWIHQPIRVKSQKVEFEKPFILPNEKKISPLQDILPSLEAAAHARRPLVIIAEGVDGEALAACILNKLRGQLQVASVKAPGFGDSRKSILGDLAILTGGTVFTDELDIKLERDGG